MVLDAVLDERGRRLWQYHKALGHGGQNYRREATGLSRVPQNPTPDVSRADAVGRPGSLVEPTSRGDPEVAPALDVQECGQLRSGIVRKGKGWTQRWPNWLAELAHAIGRPRKAPRIPIAMRNSNTSMPK